MAKGKPVRIYRIEDAQGRQVNQWFDERSFFRVKSKCEKSEYRQGYRYFIGEILWEEQ